MIPVLLNQLTNNNTEFVEKCAECLGNLAEAGGSITADVIDKSLNQAIAWLQIEDKKSQDIKKYSAVLILREFCKKLPVITFSKLFASYQVDPKSGAQTNRLNVLLVFQAFRDNRE